MLLLGRVLLESTVLGCLRWLGFVVFYWEKTVFGWCGRSTSSTGIKLQQVETVEKGWAATVVVFKVAALATAIYCFPSTCHAEKSGNDYSQELQRFNRKWLEECVPFETPQSLQPKLIAVE